MSKSTTTCCDIVSDDALRLDMYTHAKTGPVAVYIRTLILPRSEHDLRLVRVRSRQRMEKLGSIGELNSAVLGWTPA